MQAFTPIRVGVRLDRGEKLLYIEGVKSINPLSRAAGSRDDA